MDQLSRPIGDQLSAAMAREVTRVDPALLPPFVAVLALVAGDPHLFEEPPHPQVADEADAGRTFPGWYCSRDGCGQSVTAGVHQ